MTHESRLRTHVGHAGHGDNRFRGRSVADALTGRTPYWSLISQAVGNRDLSPQECSELDALSAAACAAAPRIWPLKSVRLGAAHGSATAGLVAGLLATDGVHGPRVSGLCAAVLVAVATAIVGHDDDAALEAALERHFAVRVRPIPGFGVAARAQDERVAAFAAWRARAGHDGGRHWALMRRIEAIAIRRRRTPVNISGAAAAVLLDLDFTPAQIHLPAMFVIVQNLVANAVEGAAQAPAILRQLPPDAIEYVGVPPRRSPRAGG
ncbi:MAG: hypothetical protein IPN32_25965 [Deltaproteobacteria bacterium]|nr:hypothetical protein [Deltaproteobacteria bacterium]